MPTSRAELTVQERADHIAEWVKLTDEKVKAQVAPLTKPHDRGRPNQGINAAVRELGIDRTEAQRAVKIAGIDRRRVAPIQKTRLKSGRGNGGNPRHRGAPLDHPINKCFLDRPG